MGVLKTAHVYTFVFLFNVPTYLELLLVRMGPRGRIFGYCHSSFLQPYCQPTSSVKVLNGKNWVKY